MFAARAAFAALQAVSKPFNKQRFRVPACEAAPGGERSVRFC
jgi:hypothetical protein